MSQVKNDNNPLGALWNSVTKEAGRVVSEAGRHVAESIGEVSKAVTEGGIVGGAVAALDKFSLGSIVTGAVDSIIPGADLPKPLAEGIAAGVNILSGNPIWLLDAYQAISGAGGGANAPAGAPAGGATRAPGNAAGGQRMQTPEPPPSSPRPSQPAPQEPTRVGTMPVPHPGGGTLFHGSRDGLVLVLGAGDDSVDIRRTGNGNVRITVNGESITLSAADAARLTISGGGGNDRITVGPGVTDVWVSGGNGDDDVNSSGDRTRIDTGSGNDTIRVSGNGAVVSGGRGNDDIVVVGNNARVDGGFGRDRVTVTGNNARITGGLGADTITVRGNNARVDGGAHSDTINVRGNNARVGGGAGSDTINVRGNNARVEGGNGNDRITVRGNSANIFGDRADMAADFASRHNEFIGRAREHIETGGGYAVVDSAMDGLEGMYGEIDQMLGGGKAGDATRKRLAEMEKESAKGIAELDKILNNPNLSFEDMIFMLMGALMKQSQNDVKGMTKQVREDKIAFDETKRQLTADVDAKEAKVLELEAKVRADPKDEGAAKQLGQAKSELRTAGEERNDKISDNNDSRQEQLEAIKNAMNKITEMQQALSNILNSMHQTAMNTIGNIR